jgi:hypothetical protein
MVQIPGQVSIDLTPDVIAAMAEVQTGFRTSQLLSDHRDYPDAEN